MGDTAISFEAPDVDLSGADDGADVEAGGESTALEGTESSTEGETSTESETEAGKPFLAVENGKLSPAAKALLEKIKADNPANPQLSKAVQRALFAEDRLRRELPGGFKELSQIREKIEQLGGDEGIQKVQKELNGFREFDGLLTAGKPEALDFFLKNQDGTPSEIGESAFMKLAPAVFDKFRELNKEGYSAYVSQVFFADMRENELPMTIRLLGSVLGRATLSEPDKAEAQELYSALTGYVNRIGEYAKKQIMPPTVTAKPGADQRAADLDTREQNIRRQEWETATSKNHSRIFNEAWRRLNARVPAGKEQAVKDLYDVRLKQALAAKKDFDPMMNRYFNAKQKDGFVRLHESTFKDVVPLVLRTTLAEFGVGARKAPAAKTTDATTRTAAPAKPATGFTPVAAKPSIGEVNNVLTTPTMWQNRQAILKTGKRVSW